MHANLAAVPWADVEVIERASLSSEGVSGSRLERVVTADGRRLVVKTLDSGRDWVMRATGDDGRILRLWSAGVLRRLPAGVDAAVETVEATPRGWLVVMRDVTQALLPPGRMITRAQSRRILAAASSVHLAFGGIRLDGLCPLVDRLSFLAPSTARAVPNHALREMILEGWHRFWDLAPAELGPPLRALLERPGRLAAALAAHPEALLHGDLKIANVGLDRSAVILLDWGTLTGPGPPAVDHAWYLAINSAAVDASLDDLLADSIAALRPEDRKALPMALLGAVLQLGWEKALGATSDDRATRARERAGLAWWCARATEALEQWSPV